MASLEDSICSSDDATFKHPDEEGFLKHVAEYDDFRSFIDDEKLTVELEKDSLHGLNRYITGQFKDKKIVVGVTGSTGTGKSSLVNALRGLKAKDKGAAPVGVTENTTTIQSYPYPGNENIILKEFPRVGTQDFPQDKYLHLTKILESSVVIIVSSTRFIETDMWLAKQVNDNRKNVLFVRSKIDIDMYNMEKNDPDNFSEYTCMEKIKTNIKENLKRGMLDQLLVSDVIFLVSSRQRTKYDFLSLERKLTSLLSMKVEAICHHLFAHMEKSISNKTDKMKKDFLGRKIASVLTGFLPIRKLESTVEKYHVKKIIAECQAKYCLDKDSIALIATEIDMPKYEIESRLNSYDTRVTDEHHLYTNTEDEIWVFLQKYSKYTFPGLGMLYSAYKSPVTIQECLNKVCDIMAKDELMLVRLRLSKLEMDLKK